MRDGMGQVAQDAEDVEVERHSDGGGAEMGGRASVAIDTAHSRAIRIDGAPGWMKSRSPVGGAPA